MRVTGTVPRLCTLPNLIPHPSVHVQYPHRIGQKGVDVLDIGARHRQPFLQVPTAIVVGSPSPQPQGTRDARATFFIVSQDGAKRTHVEYCGRKQ